MNPIKKTIEVLTGHRLATTTLITAALMLQAETDNKFIAHGFGSYITAFLVGFARDYSPTEDWGKRFFLRKDMTPIENILNLIRHNPVIIGAIGAAIGGITYPEVLATNQQRELSPEGQKAFYTIMGIGAGGIISETAAHCLIKQRKRRRISQSLPERVYNFCFERPYIPGLIISTTTFLSRYETYAHLASGNKPISAQVVNAMSAFGIGIITTIGLSFAGDLLHTHSLRTLYNKAKKLQLRLQNRESALEQEIQRSNTLALTAEDKIKSRVELARYYTKTLREAEAAREYREAIRLMTTRKEKDFSYVFFTKQLFKGPLYHLAKKAIRKIKGVDSTSIDQIILDLLDGDEAAIEFLEKKDLNLLNIQERYLYGLAYKLAGREQKGETIQRQAIEQAIFQGELVPFGEKSRNPCFRLRLDSFFLDEIIAKQGEKSALEKEEENCRTQARILKEYPNFDVPVPIGVLAVEDKHFYVMEFERGESLQKRIETSTCSQLDLEQIVTLTSILHANISLDQAAQPEREYQKYITNGLERLKTSQDAIDAISQGLIPIVESLNAIAKVVGQDPHPRNIHFKEYGGIVILDREPGKTTTLTAETADLLDYTQGIPEQTKQHVAQRQFKEFSKFSRTKTDSDQYMLAYLNCRILRALERFVVIEDREKAQGDIKNSLDALKVINDTFPNYYQTHHEEYSQLAKGLRMLYIK